VTIRSPERGRLATDRRGGIEAPPQTHGGLRQSEVLAARLGYALSQARPWFSTLRIAAELAERGLHGARRRPYRCKRLRRLIRAYAACVAAGIEPWPDSLDN
jgi:hypothetical protein